MNLIVLSFLSVLLHFAVGAGCGCSRVKSCSLPGLPGKDGLPGQPGRDGRDGPPGPVGLTGGGTKYIRWGRTVCPNIAGTEFVYDGLAAGGRYSTNRGTGGGANYICMANGNDAEYHVEATTANLNLSVLRGAEYRMQNGQALDHLVDYFVPCAVCEVSSRSKLLMIPGRYTCPDTWTVEYSGWLAAASQVVYICLDKTPETVPESGVNTNAARMHHVEAACSAGLPCPNYDNTKELACVVCTK